MWDGHDPSALLDSAIRASLHAGRRLMAIYRSDYEVRQKRDLSPVTEGDLQSQEAIREVLTGDTPQIPMLSEEQAEVPFDTRRDWPVMWVVDPLDGTKEFVSENGEFTTNIALVSAGRPVLGVVFAPAVGVMYWAAAGIGAFKAEVAGPGSGGADSPASDPAALRAGGRALREIAAGELGRAGSPAAGRRGLAVAASRSHLNTATKRYVSWLSSTHGDPAWTTAGSSIKLCLVAEGAADVYPRLGTTMEWDTAAGDAVARVAGAQVVSYATGAPLTYNKPDLHNPWFIVRRL